MNTRLRAMFCDHLSILRGKYLPNSKIGTDSSRFCRSTFGVHYDKDLLDAPGAMMMQGLPDMELRWNEGDIREGWERSTHKQKVIGIKSLAHQIKNKTFKPSLISKMSDEEAIIYLSQLRQIGRWSAEMILLFTYNRSNIWPIQDIGLLRAISKNYKKEYLPPMKFVDLLQKRFSPYCSVATWYLWRSIDPEPIQY